MALMMDSFYRAESGCELLPQAFGSIPGDGFHGILDVAAGEWPET